MNMMLVLPWYLFWGAISVLCIVAIIRFALGLPVTGGKVCPECKSRVFKEAKVCRFCQHKFDDNSG